MLKLGRCVTRQILIVGALVLVPTLSSAQRPRTLVTGERVRVHAPSILTAPFEGRVLAVAADTIFLTSGNDVLRLALARRDVATVAVSEGRPRGRRALIGGLIGLVAGAALGAYVLDRQEPESFAALAGLFAGGVLGAPTGAVVGAITAPERWSPAVPLATRQR